MKPSYDVIEDFDVYRNACGKSFKPRNIRLVYAVACTMNDGQGNFIVNDLDCV